MWSENTRPKPGSASSAARCSSGVGVVGDRREAQDGGAGDPRHCSRPHPASADPSGHQRVPPTPPRVVPGRDVRRAAAPDGARVPGMIAPPRSTAGWSGRRVRARCGAYEELIRRHRDRIYRIALRITGDALGRRRRHPGGRHPALDGALRASPGPRRSRPGSTASSSTAASTTSAARAGPPRRGAGEDDLAVVAGPERAVVAGAELRAGSGGDRPTAGESAGAVRALSDRGSELRPGGRGRQGLRGHTPRTAGPCPNHPARRDEELVRMTGPTALPTPDTRLACGRGEDPLVEQVAEGRGGDLDEHQRTCPYCRAALAEFERLWRRCARSPPTSRRRRRPGRGGVAAGARRVGDEPEYGRIDSPLGHTRVAARVVVVLARHLASQVPGVEVALGRLATDGHRAIGEVVPDVEAGVSGGSTAVQITLAAAYGQDLPGARGADPPRRRARHPGGDRAGAGRRHRPRRRRLVGARTRRSGIR